VRLYDEMLAARGGLVDKAMLGAVSQFADMLSHAQCFSMSDDVSVTCSEICRSKPSSILSALDKTRAPYPLTWIEWTPNARLYSVDNGKPAPRRVGCLLMTDEAGAKGYFALAWVHDNWGIMLNPVGLIFDWDLGSTEPVANQYARAVGLSGERLPIDQRRASLKRLALPNRWSKYKQEPKEIDAIIDLELRANLMPLEFCLPFMIQGKYYPGTEKFDSWSNDLEGELPFVEAFLLLINSRNTIVEQSRDDYSRLNKARAKNRKPPLKEFINTKIKLGRIQAARAGARGQRVEGTKMHVVRGHFKIRSSGVYWWSSHARGAGQWVDRREYEVTG
jgi:hypothetical protein